MSKPENRFKCGPVSASTWAKSKTMEDEMVQVYSMNIDKVYKEGDQWKRTNSFTAEDLPKVSLVATEAYKYIQLNSSE